MPDWIRLLLDGGSKLDDLGRFAPPPWKWLLYIIGKIIEVVRENYIRSKVTVKHVAKKTVEKAKIPFTDQANRKREESLKGKIRDALADFRKNKGGNTGT